MTRSQHHLRFLDWEWEWSDSQGDFSVLLAKDGKVDADGYKSRMLTGNEFTSLAWRLSLRKMLYCPLLWLILLLFTQTPGSSLYPFLSLGPLYNWDAIIGPGFPLMKYFDNLILIWCLENSFNFHLFLHWMLIKVNALPIKIEDLNMAQKSLVSVSFLSIWSHFTSWHPYLSTLQLHRSTSVSGMHSACFLLRGFKFAASYSWNTLPHTYTGWVLLAPIQVSAQRSSLNWDHLVTPLSFFNPLCHFKVLS